MNKRPHKNSVNKSSQTKKKTQRRLSLLTRSEAGTVMIPPYTSEHDVTFFSILPMYKFAYFVQENPASVKDASRYVCNHESRQIFTEHPVHPLGNADKGI